MDIPYCACLKCGCVYFPSLRLCTYQAAVIPNRPLYLTSSLLPVSPFPVCLFSSVVCFSELLKGEIWMRRSVQCLWNYTAREATQKFLHLFKYLFFIQCETLFSAALFSLQLYFKSQISDCSHKFCRGNVMQHKQTEFPCILQWAFWCPTFFNKATSKV